MKLNKRTSVSEPGSIMFTYYIETNQYIRAPTVGYHNVTYITYMTINRPMHLLLLSDRIGKFINFKSFHV